MGVKLAIFLSCICLILSSTRAEDGHSFQHFHGPVEGDDTEVRWVDERGKKHQDYAAPAHYEFAYGVEDRNTGDYHGQREQRDGKTVAGEYTVMEPDGNVRTVKYHADEDGFHATVHNSRSADNNDDHRTVDAYNDDDDDKS